MVIRLIYDDLCFYTMKHTHNKHIFYVPSILYSFFHSLKVVKEGFVNHLLIYNEIMTTDMFPR